MDVQGHRISSKDLKENESYWGFCFADGSPVSVGKRRKVLLLWSTAEKQRDQAHVFLHAGNDFDCVGTFSIDEITIRLEQGFKIYIDPVLSLTKKEIAVVAA